MVCADIAAFQGQEKPRTSRWLHHLGPSRCAGGSSFSVTKFPNLGFDHENVGKVGGSVLCAASPGWIHS